MIGIVLHSTAVYKRSGHFFRENRRLEPSERQAGLPSGAGFDMMREKEAVSVKAFFLPEGTTMIGMVMVGNPWVLLLWLWLAVINLAAFAVFGYDKWKAKYKRTHPAARRVPEKTLFVLAALGGSVGALVGMRVWHHKTLHKSFRIGIPAILIAQLGLALGLWLIR